MPRGPIRRTQLIAPFSVGAMVVVRDGTSLIVAGLDHWYKREDGSTPDDPSEFRVEEWRLARQLRVNHFRLPPDYRKPNKGEMVPNASLTVPFLRFPQWHFCPFCARLEKFPLTVRGKVECPECAGKKKNRYMVQVPIIAVCEQGHIQDFPWREWVHRSARPTCQKPMRLIGTGSATLLGLVVTCECDAQPRRSLGGITRITEAEEDEINRSEELDSSNLLFRCRGKLPWLGTEEGRDCSCNWRGSLLNATNIHYPQTRSAIYLERGNNPELMSLLEAPPLSRLIQLLPKTHVTPSVLKEQHFNLLKDFDNNEIEAALRTILFPEETSSDGDYVEGDDRETTFRRAEFNILKTVCSQENLKIRAENLNKYQPDIARYFSRIMLVDKLRETRALTGFTRIFPENEQSLEALQSMLWRQPPPQEDSWLPAYIVYGEGIFIEFDENRLREWLDQHGDKVSQRVEPLVRRYQQAQERRHLRERRLTPRLILLHTFAHLLMNRLTFECGYSSAALRERLYVSDNPKGTMAGILIYTAAGDSEGTMGGLVRMGKPGNFEPMVDEALKAASWCSADPVCMEMAEPEKGGQGPDSCNLAACHNCALVPETACEEFNRFLDRGVVVGNINNPNLGFFKYPEG